MNAQKTVGQWFEQVYGCIHARARARGIAILAAAFAAVILGVANPASAQRSPPTCTQSGLGVSSGVVTVPGATSLVHGDEMCFQVEIFNICPGCCDVTGLNSEIVLPDGSIVPITVDADVLFGDDFLCPGGPQCATASTCTLPGEVGYRYIIAHGDEHGETGTNCPPTPADGTGELSGFLRIAGTVHSAIHRGVGNPCHAYAIGEIPHACCEPCTGTCTDVFSANDCPFPGVYSSDKNCDEITCTPLTCDDGKSCTNPDVCNPATGTCVFTPVHADCDDGNSCTGPDICDPGNPAADPQTGCVREERSDCDLWHEMQLCLSAPGVVAASDCLPFDYNGDGHVNLEDVSEFMLNLGLP